LTGGGQGRLRRFSDRLGYFTSWEKMRIDAARSRPRRIRQVEMTPLPQGVCAVVIRIDGVTTRKARPGDDIEGVGSGSDGALETMPVQGESIRGPSRSRRCSFQAM
jgi:hypothetical protein